MRVARFLHPGSTTAGLGVVVGRRRRNVPARWAAQVIGDWTAGNDVSARDRQRQAKTVTLGRSQDGYGPTDPWLTTPDEIEDLHHLTIRTTVNGDERQHGSTSDMIHDAFEQIAFLSSRCTLEPGDLFSSLPSVDEVRRRAAEDAMRVLQGTTPADPYAVPPS